MKIIRVFPTKTKMTPDDELCLFGNPGLFIPKHDEVHISVVFTWDIEKAKRLQKQWQGSTDKPVKVGGPAFGDPGGQFVPGRYLKKGITITSRGCTNKCKHCFVPDREGQIRELEIISGNILQDNNLLACSDGHLDKVFEMLKTQKGIDFRGLEAKRINKEVVLRLCSIKKHIQKIWLAYDNPKGYEPFKKAIELLKPHFNQNKLRCYVLCGYEEDTPQKADGRCREVFKMGALPFAMLFRPDKEIKAYSRSWKNFQRIWTRPAIFRGIMLNSENYKELRLWKQKNYYINIH